jgi:glycosyltransferase involved in cell wall biosynthesis
VFPGYLFGRGYWELQKHAYLFCAPTEVGGTHPVILEAMAAGNCVLVNDHAPNVETAGDAGVYFSGEAGVDDLCGKLTRLLAEPELVERHRQRARLRAEDYSWEIITDQYEQMLSDVCAAVRHGPLPRSLLDPEPVVAPEVSSELAASRG